MTSSTQSSIVVSGVDKTYYPSPPWMKVLVRSNIKEPIQALQGIDFSVDPGEIVAVVGPNGAGKTTAFRILVGLTTPTNGTAAVMGYDAARESTQVRALVGWMPGDHRSLLMRLTCEENLRFHGRLQGLRPRGLDRAVRHSLDLVDLGHAAKKTVFALSAGMKARLQLARALLHRPSVLVLDEPTGAVDPVAAHGLLELIVGIVQDQNIAAVLSSHRLEEIEALHSRVILLDRGKIRYDGDLETLRHRLDHPCIEIQFSDPAGASAAVDLVKAAEQTISAELTTPDKARIVLDHGVTTGAVLTGLEELLPQIMHLTEIKRPLRDILAEIYGGNPATAHHTEPPETRRRRR